MKKTKIICTIGPASGDKATFEKMAKADEKKALAAAAKQKAEA